MSQAGQNVDASGLSRWDGQPLTLYGPCSLTMNAASTFSVARQEVLSAIAC